MELIPERQAPPVAYARALDFFFSGYGVHCSNSLTEDDKNLALGQRDDDRAAVGGIRVLAKGVSSCSFAPSNT